MIAQVRETFARPLVVSWAVLWGGIVFAGGMFAALLRLSYVIGSWQTATETSINGLKAATHDLAVEQQAGKGRGDALRSAVADTRQSVAVLQSQMASANTKLDVVDNKLDRLIERRFGAVQPTGGVVPVDEGAPFQ